MNIHSILAALLGSTALGYYAPLSLSFTTRTYVLGVWKDGIAPIELAQNTVIGIPKDNVASVELVQNTVIGVPKDHLGFVELVQSIVFGLSGGSIYPQEIAQHHLIVYEYTGYGFGYGTNYGSD